MDKSGFFEKWLESIDISPNIVYSRFIKDKPGTYIDFPYDIPEPIKTALEDLGIQRLYSHQHAAWSQIKKGRNIVISTGTSSGKSLCYMLPIFDSILSTTTSRSLLVFPTKALTNDQMGNFSRILERLQCNENFSALSRDLINVYDGDTPGDRRKNSRTTTRILFTNPDMLHVGILPHHTLWDEVIKSLRYIVIDEIHLYRGVFGSHLANIIRRLKRICHFYGSYPQFILTSATIANPREHAEKLIEEEVELIDHDGSPHGTKNFVLYNPPVVNAELGIRRGLIHETLNLCQDLIESNIQTITFARSRREVELIIRNLLDKNEIRKSSIRGYRSGYLPKDRREIESGLKSGNIKMVVATNALELGVDIGGMDAIIMVGYPGTIASVKQQSGRAGRRLGHSLAVLVASSIPLDQYLVMHPEFLFDRSPENALIDPDNLLLLLQHLRCAAFELPFKKNEPFGKVNRELLEGLLGYLEESGVLYLKGEKFFWLADQYPASQISIRSASNETINIHVMSEGESKSIGQIDYQSALWMVHPGAVYMHDGSSYLVESLDLDKKQALIQPFDLDYYTLPQIHSEISLIELTESKEFKGGSKNYGEILVSEQVIGYKRIRWNTQEILGIEPIDYLPSIELRTTGYWMTLSDDTVDQLRIKGLWLSDPNEYGKEWSRIRQEVRGRDHYMCQSCGLPESTQEHHVHHKIPFRQFSDPSIANRLDNLVTLCANCHTRAEMLLRIRSGLSGLCYAFSNIAPLFLMCDINDLGSSADPQCKFTENKPSIVIYDQIPGGIGLSRKIFERHDRILEAVNELITRCSCSNGCPSCVGPSGPLSESGKNETIALINCLRK